MSFIYDPPSKFGAFRQGELLGEVWEHRAEYPPSPLPEGSPVLYRSIHHHFAFVMSPDCDLDQDFNVRFSDELARETYTPTDTPASPNTLIPHVLLCDVYEMNQIRNLVPPGKDIWKRIQQNQDERYHHFEPAPVGNPVIVELSDLYLDFKKIFSISTESLYEGLKTGTVGRLAIVPPIYVHDLTHRFYGFLSRVALPT